MAIIRDTAIRGRHGSCIIELTKRGIFAYNWQIFVAAPLLGLQAGRRPDAQTGGEVAQISMAQLSTRSRDIMFIFRLIMLADRDYEPDLQRRLGKAFRYVDPDTAESQRLYTPADLQSLREDEERFRSYLRGGIEVLHEELIGAGGDTISNIGDFIEQRLPPAARPSIADKIGLPLPGSQS